MGLLDDAIREHLELKRRRGGDPSEIERAERDALGPVRREPEPIQPAAYDETEGADAELAPGLAGGDDLYEHPFEVFEPDEFADSGALEPTVEDDELADPYAPAPGGLPPEPEPPLPHGAVGTGPEAPASSEPFRLRDDKDPWVAPPPDPPVNAMPHEEVQDDPFAAPRHDPLPEPAEPAAEPPAGLPREHDNLNQETAEYRIEHAHGDEDPLEETPEFLQDTPDHDRLWFEQRPPRDFDFDK
jgi:hypothetical protein